LKRNCLIKSAFPQTKTTQRNFGTLNLDIKRRLSFGKVRGKFTGKELDPETGLYYFGARYLDPKTSRWLSGDPAVGEYVPSAPVNDEAKKRNGNLPGQGGVFNYVNLHVYHYAGNNPVKYRDPDGMYIEVTANEDGTYTVTGGTQNRDRNIYIMKDGERTGEILGQTFTKYSFFDEKGNVVAGAVINPNDSSGQDFIDDIKSNTPTLIQYIPNAVNREEYDFKSKGGNDPTNHYRGMPIKDAKGNTVYGTARDVGNYVAGYVAGRNGLNFILTRAGLDAYNTLKNGNGIWTPEPMVSRSAQDAGYYAGTRQLLGTLRPLTPIR
jgi:RHS repeat-associated protein